MKKVKPALYAEVFTKERRFYGRLVFVYPEGVLIKSMLDRIPDIQVLPFRFLPVFLFIKVDAGRIFEGIGPEGIAPNCVGPDSLRLLIEDLFIQAHIGKVTDPEMHFILRYGKP